MSPMQRFDERPSDPAKQYRVRGGGLFIWFATTLLTSLIAGGMPMSQAADQGTAGSSSKEPPASTSDQKSEQKSDQKADQKTEQKGERSSTPGGAGGTTQPVTPPAPAHPPRQSSSSHQKEGQKEGESKASSAPAEKRPASGEGSVPAATPPPSEPVEEPAKKTLGSVILTAKLALMADPRLFPYEIEVEVDGARAVLSGKVSSAEEQLAATEVVQTLPSIKEVVNKLVATPDVKAALGKHHDELITQYVRDRFARSETLKAAGFEVTCQNGVVALKGDTRFQVIALEAAQAARQVPGVKAVNTAAVHLAGTVIEKEKEPPKEPSKEPAKEPAKEPTKEPTKEPAKESGKEPVKEPGKEPKKEPAKVKEKE